MRAPALRTQTSTGMSSWRKQEPALLPTPPSNTYVLRLSLVGIAHIPSSVFQGVPGELTWGLIVLGRNHLSVHAAPCLGMTPDLVLGELCVFASSTVVAQSTVYATALSSALGSHFPFLRVSVSHLLLIMHSWLFFFFSSSSVFSSLFIAVHPNL